MSKRIRRTTWQVPQDQVIEFMKGPINYEKLIEDCLKQYIKAAFDLNNKKKVKVVAKKYEWD